MASSENIVIKFIKPSVLKSSPVQSAVLDSSKKALVSANSDVVVTEKVEAPDQHLKLVLESPVLAMDGKTYLSEHQEVWVVLKSYQFLIFPSLITLL